MFLGEILLKISKCYDCACLPKVSDILFTISEV